LPQNSTIWVLFSSLPSPFCIAHDEPAGVDRDHPPPVRPRGGALRRAAADAGHRRSGYGGVVSEVSEAGMRLLAEIVQDRLDGPRILYDAWAAGLVSDLDLRGLIPDTWL
jgi:hypothetical protein